MGQPFLNEDVLLYIMSFYSATDRRTVCALMQTSRLFHYAGARYLLGDGVSLYHNDQVESFLNFMDADCGHRFPLLRTFELTISTQPFSTGYRLALLFHQLARMGALRSLRIKDAEGVLRSHPELPQAVAEVSTLKSLCMHNAGARAWMLVKHLQSELVYANLLLPPERVESCTDDEDCTDDEEDDGEPDEDEDAWEDVEVANGDPFVLPEDELELHKDNLVAVLHRSQNSLRELHVTCAYDYSDETTDVVFPNVISLTLHADYLDEPCTGYLARMFPRLQELEARGFNPARQPFDIMDYEQRRIMNVDNQRECGAWRALRYFEGTLEVLYSLGIMYPIPWLKLTTEDHELEPEILADALHDARPVHLFLSFWGVGAFLDEEFLEIFAEAGARKLETLHLVVIADEGEDDLDGLRILDAVASRIVAPLRRLREFRLNLESIYGPSTPLSPFDASLQTVDIDAYAARLIDTSAAASGSLTSVHVELPVRRKDPTVLPRDHAEVGSPMKDFYAAYGEELNALHEWDEDDEKAWSGVQRFH